MSAEISLQTEYFNIMIKIPCLDIMRLFYTTLTGGVSQRTRRCFGEGCEGMNGFYQTWPLCLSLSNITNVFSVRLAIRGKTMQYNSMRRAIWLDGME